MYPYFSLGFIRINKSKIHKYSMSYKVNYEARMSVSNTPLAKMPPIVLCEVSIEVKQLTSRMDDLSWSKVRSL